MSGQFFYVQLKFTPKMGIDRVPVIKQHGAVVEVPKDLIQRKQSENTSANSREKVIVLELARRAALVPVADVKKNSEHLQLVEDWLRSYRPEEFFDEHGAPQADILAYCPQGDRRMGCNPHAFGGRPRRSLYCPPLAECAVEILAKYLAKVIVQNPSIFRIFSPDKLMSN